MLAFILSTYEWEYLLLIIEFIEVCFGSTFPDSFFSKTSFDVVELVEVQESVR